MVTTLALQMNHLLPHLQLCHQISVHGCTDLHLYRDICLCKQDSLPQDLLVHTYLHTGYLIAKWPKFFGSADGIDFDFCWYFGSYVFMQQWSMVHKIGPFMPSLSVFIQLMFSSICGPICKHFLFLSNLELHIMNLGDYFLAILKSLFYK